MTPGDSACRCCIDVLNAPPMSIAHIRSSCVACEMERVRYAAAVLAVPRKPLCAACTSESHQEQRSLAPLCPGLLVQHVRLGLGKITASKDGEIMVWFWRWAPGLIINLSVALAAKTLRLVNASDVTILLHDGEETVAQLCNGDLDAEMAALCVDTADAEDAAQQRIEEAQRQAFETALSLVNGMSLDAGARLTVVHRLAQLAGRPAGQ